MDKTEFVQRVRACERKLYRVAKTLLASDADCEDAVQEALLRAWMKRSSLREAAFFETWLIRILINECRTLWRRKPPTGVEFNENIADTSCGSPLLPEIIRNLPEKHRIAMELHYIEGYKTREIAQMLGTPESTVKWRLARGRKELKRALGEEV